MTHWVLLRGLTRESAHWGDFAPQLAAALSSHAHDSRGASPHAASAIDRIVAVDLPGTGRHAQVRSPRRVDAIMQACREELTARGVPPPYRLLGLSLGAMVAAAWATAWPDEVSACVLVNTSLRPYSGIFDRLALRQWPTLLRVLVGSDAAAAERAVLRLTSAAPQAHAAVLDAWVAIRRARPVTRANALRQLFAAARYRHRGPAPRAPVLVVHGAGDALVAPRCSIALADAWRVERVMHPHAGHDLPLDAGPWLADRVAAWLARQSAARA